MFRSLSKVASTASAAATAAMVSVSTAAAEYPMKPYRHNSDSRLMKPYPGPQYSDDEYDFCQEDAQGAYIGGVPSQEEVDAATRDLQASFAHDKGHKSHKSPKIRDCEACDDSVGDGETEGLSIGKDPRTRDSQRPTPATVLPAVSAVPAGISKCTSSTEGDLQTVAVGGTNNIVARCVDLLQRDPDIQAAVVSLARDPAVWDAFVKNEKVQELLRTRSVTLPKLEGSSREDVGFSKEHENPFVIALLCVRNMVYEMVDTLVEMVGNVFGFFDQRIFGGKDSDPLDKPFKACMVLTILVLALIVMKRV